MPDQSRDHSNLVAEILRELPRIGWVGFKQAHVHGRLVNEGAPASECCGRKPAGGYIDVGVTGMTDLWAFKPDGALFRLAFIEVKTGTGRLAPAQATFRAAALRRGAIHVAARSVEDVVRALSDSPQDRPHTTEPARVALPG